MITPKKRPNGEEEAEEGNVFGRPHWITAPHLFRNLLGEHKTSRSELIPHTRNPY